MSFNQCYSTYTDLEEKMEKGQIGGVVIGKEKLWTIMYADDIVLVGERRN